MERNLKEIILKIINNKKVFTPLDQYLLIHSYGLTGLPILTEEELAEEKNMTVQKLIKMKTKSLLKLQRIIIARHCYEEIAYFSGLSYDTKLRILKKEQRKTFCSTVQQAENFDIQLKLNQQKTKEELTKQFYNEIKQVVYLYEVSFEFHQLKIFNPCEASQFLEKMKIRLNEQQYEQFIAYLDCFLKEPIELPKELRNHILLICREFGVAYQFQNRSYHR